ncbi:MAG: hypothetical protein K8M05_28525 [Deltaproteobacteria bacterium]|nr:hypothetical protein [Kofleriaceae bacterium]
MGNTETWAIILAGGEGKRLSSLTRALYGRDVPKQFAVLAGERSLLQETIERAGRMTELARTVVVVSRPHEVLAREQLAPYPGVHLLVQPHGLDTGPGLLFPISYVRARAPEARVVVLPADHHVPNVEPMRRGAPRGAAAGHARRRRGRPPRDRVRLDPARSAGRRARARGGVERTQLRRETDRGRGAAAARPRRGVEHLHRDRSGRRVLGSRPAAAAASRPRLRAVGRPRARAAQRRAARCTLCAPAGRELERRRPCRDVRCAAGARRDGGNRLVGLGIAQACVREPARQLRARAPDVAHHGGRRGGCMTWPAAC